MTMKHIAIGLTVLAVLAVGAFVWASIAVAPAPNNGGNATTTPDNMIRVTSPQPNATVSSPLKITGEARGNWYFEASFPVRLEDANGNILAQAPAQAQGEWMTTEFVPFEVDLPFAAPTTATGVLVLEKDNPSGLPEHADERRIPVRFANVSTETQTIKLYYYNPANDKDAQGNILCSAKGLVAVQRTIPKTTTPLAEAIKLLLKGELTVQEKVQGVATEFPLGGVSLTSATITNGVATLTFADPQNKTVGGSCRVGVLWKQIEATAKQFPTVTSVQFKPEELFQP